MPNPRFKPCFKRSLQQFLLYFICSPDMKFAPLIIALFLSMISIKAWGQCPPGQDSIRVEINHNNFFADISWKITSLDGNIQYGNGLLQDTATNVFIVCVPKDQCVNFCIKSLSSGLFPDGWYRLFVNDTLVYQRLKGSFSTAMETVKLNCPAGTSCVSPVYLGLGSGLTPTAGETWFSFIPQDTGVYVFATCGAACPTKIWVYDRCAGVFISEIYLGTIAYTTDGCPDSSASLQLHLQGGAQYYIRLRYQEVGCSPELIPYSMTYIGPVVGCTDPLACNFEPFATVSSGNCIYPGDPDCPDAPDFVMNQDFLLSTLAFKDYFSQDPCLIEDGCIRGTGNRYIVEFATQITNIGDADYYIGPTPAPPSIIDTSMQFVYDPCHQHWHYMGYAEYILYNSQGYRVPIGTKVGFCVLDAFCFGVDKKYKCNNMGISAGCGDVYGPDTECQWIDITDIPADDYTMVVRVNWDKSPDKLGRVEKRYDNNWAQACFTLVYDGNTPDVIFNSDSCKQFTDCNGEIYGNALPDCNGICNGPALIGDWNQDTLRNEADVPAYLAAALADNGAPTLCNDLHDDLEINVFDAALLQECVHFADSQLHWIQRFPCQFPTGFQNDQELVTLMPGAIDTIAKTFDIEIVNPYREIMAYEFSVSGLVIESVENLATEHHVTPLFNAATGEIIALATDGSAMNKNFSPTAFLRVHYSTLSDHMVCVSKITAVVNHKYQKSNASLADPNCIPVTYVAAKEPFKAAFEVYVQPNPMRESSTVFFENEASEPMTFTLMDVTGRIIRSFGDIRETSVRIERGNLPEGPYLFSLRGSRGIVTGKLLMQ